MDFSTRYAALNSAQKQAVDTIDGPVMVIAGPGTGKTELLSMRTANILQKTDTLPQNILCLTFTESGATAMRERLRRIIGPSAYNVGIYTFHGFGTEVINQNGAFFYHGSDFKPADDLTSYEILQGIFDTLAYDNPIASKLDGEYTHLNDTLKTISELKQSGLTSDELLAILDTNDRVIDEVEKPLQDAFAARLSKSTISTLLPLVEIIRSVDGTTNIPSIPALSTVLADSLEAALSDATEQNSTKPISAWRTLWMRKDDNNQFALKAKLNATKLRAVSYVYYQYLLKMQEAKLYDFDDMILRVVHAMEVFPELRFNLQERYQYIMVDEFQDTNLAQMRILYNLTNNEVNADNPNILVVGDDDQAIYSFQGADVGNINGFLKLFPQTTRITLTDNYRSSATILEKAREVIVQGETRLETLLPDLNKTLTPHMIPKETKVALVELPTATDERAWIAQDIATKIKSGIPAETIAILARRHREIEALLPYLLEQKIPVAYEKQHNVLDLEPIQLIELVGNILVSLYEGRLEDADSLMPQLLAHPAFRVAPLSVWQLSLRAQESHKGWLEVMSVSPDFIPLHTWLITRSQELPHTPLERMIDRIIGRIDTEEPYLSPIANYFFSVEALKASPEQYVTYLEGLRSIRTKLLEHHPNEVPTLQAFLEFVQLHRDLRTTLMNIKPAASDNTAVKLMSAHKSKGLEFDHVYIMGTIDSAWGERVRTRSRLIGYPANLPLATAGDTYDERLRLFFVAMTRAKTHLTLSYSLANDLGKDTLAAKFLTGIALEPTTATLLSSMRDTTTQAEIAWYQPVISPVTSTLKEALMPLLERYKLSATHVNAFLDITHGGPGGFLVNNLLRFPQGKSPSASYGSAIHTALQRAHSHLAATGKQRPHEDILHDYEESLRSAHLTEHDFQAYLQKGSMALSTYLNAKYDTFIPSQKAELNFAGQSVFIGDAHLTGSLDLVDFSDNSITITDYKTGRPAKSWQGRDEYEKVKLHKYKQQLMFYYLLVTHSRDFAKYDIEKAVLQFIEATPQQEIVSLEARFSREDLEEFAQLVQIIWRHIQALDLPDVSGYDTSYQGIIAFEKDLLEGKI
ncbi:MAG TPA: ATP-dependent DNA helicase [Candidatus Saccharimonadales bacterium]|nr:ATP-dependent DNA helicase [Candidatus Saccharimonadales bacterium]